MDLEDVDLLNERKQFVLHAGRPYYNELLPLLRDAEIASVRIPTEGQRIGGRMAWYNDCL